MKRTYSGLAAMLSSEFARYLRESPAASHRVPANAMIVFSVSGEPGFNRWHRTLSLRNREAHQPVYRVNVRKWRLHWIIEDAALQKVA